MVEHPFGTIKRTLGFGHFLQRGLEAVTLIMENTSADGIGELINIGTGREITIRDLAVLVSSVVGYDREVEWDTT